MGSSFRRVLYVNWSWELAGAGAEKRGENIHIRGRGSHHLEQLAVKSIPLGDALVQLVRHLRRTHHRPRTIHLESCQMQMRRGQKKKKQKGKEGGHLLLFFTIIICIIYGSGQGWGEFTYLRRGRQTNATPRLLTMRAMGPPYNTRMSRPMFFSSLLFSSRLARSCGVPLLR